MTNLTRFLAAVIFCITLVFTSACSSTSSTENNASKVLIAFVCQHEKIIMKLAHYDSQSDALASQYFNMLMMAKQCLLFQRPVEFEIEEVVAEYKDYNETDMLVLKVHSPVKKEFKGYVLVIKNKLNKKKGTI